MSLKYIVVILFIFLLSCTKENVISMNAETTKVQNSNEINDKQPLTFVQKDLGTETRQGLKFVNDVAVAHIDKYNQQYGTKYESLEPDFRIFVNKCLVPLRAEWGSFEQGYVMNYDPNAWFVKVYCDKTLKSTSNPQGKGWDILVPTTRPKHSDDKSSSDFK